MGSTSLPSSNKLYFLTADGEYYERDLTSKTWKKGSSRDEWSGVTNAPEDFSRVSSAYVAETSSGSGEYNLVVMDGHNAGSEYGKYYLNKVGTGWMQSGFLDAKTNWGPGTEAPATNDIIASFMLGGMTWFLTDPGKYYKFNSATSSWTSGSLDSKWTGKANAPQSFYMITSAFLSTDSNGDERLVVLDSSKYYMFINYADSSKADAWVASGSLSEFFGNPEGVLSFSVVPEKKEEFTNFHEKCWLIDGSCEPVVFSGEVYCGHDSNCNCSGENYCGRHDAGDVVKFWNNGCENDAIELECYIKYPSHYGDAILTKINGHSMTLQEGITGDYLSKISSPSASLTSFLVGSHHDSDEIFVSVDGVQSSLQDAVNLCGNVKSSYSLDIVFGHSANEILVNIDGERKMLQSAINDGDFCGNSVRPSFYYEKCWKVNGVCVSSLTNATTEYCGHKDSCNCSSENYCKSDYVNGDLAKYWNHGCSEAPTIIECYSKRLQI